MKDMLMTAIAMVAVASLAGCSANADLDTNTSGSNEQEETNVPVSFNSYLAQSKTTRAGETTRASEMTTTELQNTGFGVVAYYTDNGQYTAGQTSTEPNFMYNTQVSGSNWTYSPTVYWPNRGSDAGATPGEAAAYVSFFAYAPYKEVTLADGTTGAKVGITALSKNSVPGDPTVSYTLGATGTDADLLIGTAGGDGNGNTTSGAKQVGTTLTTNAKCSVNANMTKMVVSGKVKFNFKHALAKFGGTGTSADGKTGLQVVADIDNGTAVTGGTLNADETKITVKSIKIESVNSDGTKDNSIATSGTLNLATGVWTTADANNGKIDYEINSPAVTATKGATTQTMNKNIAEPAPVVEGKHGWSDFPTGVTTTAQSVYTETNPMLIIPDGKDHTFRITIDYIVRTKNVNLAKGYTEVEQSFYKDLTLSKVTMNAKYNLLIHLGLTSVKFDAEVSSWDNTVAGGTTTGTTESSDPIVIYMPKNVASSTTSTSGN